MRAHTQTHTLAHALCRHCVHRRQDAADAHLLVRGHAAPPPGAQLPHAARERTQVSGVTLPLPCAAAALCCLSLPGTAACVGGEGCAELPAAPCWLYGCVAVGCTHGQGAWTEECLCCLHAHSSCSCTHAPHAYTHTQHTQHTHTHTRAHTHTHTLSLCPSLTPGAHTTTTTTRAS